MIKKVSILVVFLLLFLTSVKSSYAIVDPFDVPNNKFGIHIFNERDLENAANLVNSNGGDWGYVTVVITEAERDHGRWQKVFDQMRRLHLIPIVRLATKAEGGTWNAPQEAEINNWVAFLNSLNWVIQNRYIVINNEPNHAAEWGGRIDPESYATYLKEISQKLKAASPDFFILPAGLDPSSTNTSTSMTETRFMSQMMQAEPDIFNFIDGWTSHAYPNGGINVYSSELSFIGKRMPIFITETGWANNKYTESQISTNFINAFTNTWNDSRIIAVTPFILDYTTPPFDVYSWKKNDGTFYSFYSDVQKIRKIKGTPVQIEKGQIFASFAQPIIFTGIDFVGAILAQNTGQTIWTRDSVFIDNESKDFTLKTYSMNNIEPTKLGMIFFRASETQSKGVYTNSLFLEGTKGQKITNSFSIEAWITTLDKVQIQGFFDKMVTRFKGS